MTTLAVAAAPNGKESSFVPMLPVHQDNLRVLGDLNDLAEYITVLGKVRGWLYASRN